MLTGFVRKVHQLYVVRFLLGLAEAGSYPGIVLYLTYWFRQREQAQAIALVLVGLPVASILGGPVSGLILDHVHWLNVSSWRWLLILQGIPAVACGVLVYLLLPSRPTEAKFLARREKDWIISELSRERERKLQQHQISLTETFTHLRVWHLLSIPIHIPDRFVFPELLDAPGDQIALQPLLQHNGWLPCSNSSTCWFGEHGSGVVQFRSA